MYRTFVFPHAPMTVNIGILRERNTEYLVYKDNVKFTL
jgi:hypothetical protein